MADINIARGKDAIMQYLCKDQADTRRFDKDAREGAETLFFELRAVNALHRLSKISWSPTLKANAVALEARKQKLRSELNAWRERTCADSTSEG
jgi:hypothetical protein